MRIFIAITVVIAVMTSFQACKTFDATIDAKETCRVHDRKMKVTRTWIKYGRKEMKNLETDLLEYPHPKYNFYGGDRIYKGRPRIYKYYHCTACNKAKRREK